MSSVNDVFEEALSHKMFALRPQQEVLKEEIRRNGTRQKQGILERNWLEVDVADVMG